MVRTRHELMGELAHALGAGPQGGRGRPAGRDRAQGAGRDLAGRRPAQRPGALPASPARRARPGCTSSAGRATDRIAPEVWDDAGRPASGCADDARRAGARARARPPDHPPVPADLAPGRRGAGPARRRRDRAGAGARPPVARGRARPRGEVVLDRRRPPGRGPAAAAARGRRGRRAGRRARPADRGPAGPRVRRRCPTRGPTRPGSCWSGCSRPGRGLLAVWETLEETGALDADPARVGADPAAAARLGDPPVHRRPARRRDLHRGLRADPRGRAARRADGGRAAARHRQGRAHRAQRRGGAASPAAIATRMGFDDRRRSTWSALLVRWHLLLAETATTRDPDDPATVELVIVRVGSAEALVAARRRSPRRTPRRPRRRRGRRWRAGLVRRPARRALAALDPGVAAARRPAPRRSRCPTALRRRRTRGDRRSSRVADGARVTVIAGGPGRAARRRSPRCSRCSACRCGPPGPGPRSGYGVSVWEVADEHLDPAVLRQRFEAIVEGRVDAARAAARPPTARRSRPRSSYAPRRREQATVLEVRAADRPGRRVPGLRGARRPRRSRSARPTSTRSVRRPWTCSTSRRRIGRRAVGDRGRPRPPTPSATRLLATVGPRWRGTDRGSAPTARRGRMCAGAPPAPARSHLGKDTPCPYASMACAGSQSRAAAVTLVPACSPVTGATASASRRARLDPGADRHPRRAGDRATCSTPSTPTPARLTSRRGARSSGPAASSSSRGRRSASSWPTRETRPFRADVRACGRQRRSSRSAPRAAWPSPRARPTVSSPWAPGASDTGTSQKDAKGDVGTEATDGRRPPTRARPSSGTCR